MTFDTEKRTISIPSFVVIIVTGVFLSLLTFAYGATIQPIKDNEASLQSQIGTLQSNAQSNVNDVTTIKINVALICNALKINCQK